MGWPSPQDGRALHSLSTEEDVHDIGEILLDPAAARALEIIRGAADTAVQDMLDLVRIPAPSFEESERGAWLAERFRAAGFEDIERDAAGNVIVRSGAGTTPLVMAAHLDTVFPRGTPLEPRREGERIFAPGIADNCRGLAVMIAVATAIRASSLQPARPLVWVGSTGEEGAGTSTA
jgi:tripeptide aminopeptidase